jgi:lipopolysaccharide heptosyltransferase I
MNSTEPDRERPRVLVVKLSSLGDLFHALPTVHMVKEQLDAQVDWVVQPAYTDLVRCFTDVRRVIPFPRNEFFGGFTRYLKDLREQEYDCVLDLQGLFKSAALVTRLARGRRRVGPSHAREGARFFYTHRAGPRNMNRHAVDQLVDSVRCLGLDAGEVKFPARFPTYHLNVRKPRVALVPCSRGAAKNWAPDNFITVARALHEKKGASLVLLGGQDDIEVCSLIERGCPDGSVLNLCGKTSLVEMGGALKEVGLVISVDSGPMHMAAACGTRVLALFGVTDPRRTGPYGAGHRALLAPELAEDPELARAYRRKASNSAWTIEPQEVIEAALGMMEK